MNLVLPTISSEPSSSFFSRVAIVTQRPRQHSLNPRASQPRLSLPLAAGSVSYSVLLFKGFWIIYSISLSLYRGEILYSPVAGRP